MNSIIILGLLINCLLVCFYIFSNKGKEQILIIKSKLEQEIENSKTKINELLNENNFIKKQLYDEKNNNNSLNIDNKVLEDQNSKFLAQLDEQKDYNDIRQTNALLKKEIENLNIKINELSNENDSIKKQLEDKKNENNTLKENNKVFEEQNNNYIKQLHKQDDYDDLKKENVLLNSKLEQEKQQNAELYNKINKEIEVNFKNISNEVIKKQNLDFSNQQKIVLQPFENNLKDFKTSIDTINKTNIENKTSLEEQIKLLNLNNQNLQKEAQDLTTALKGNKKKQGDWGEIQLERLLEITNLKEGIDYTKQETTVSEDGKTHRPDFIINLPNNKRVIIDSKVSLNNYLLYLNSDIKEEQNRYLKQYFEDLKNHIKELGDKKYYKELKESLSLDYVFMFVPLERAYIDVIDNSNNDRTDIFKYSNENKVAIATPSSLMPILKIIEHLWRIEKQNKETDEIVKIGEKIYEKLYSFQEDTEKVEKGLNNVKDTYSKAIKKLYFGNDNVFKNANKLKNYGISTKKELSLEYDKNTEEE